MNDLNNKDAGRTSSDWDKRETVIRLEHISKTYSIIDGAPTMAGQLSAFFSPQSRRKIQALKDINLEIKKGEFFGIIGHNGSGKSTLLRIMAGTYIPDKGGKVFRKGSFMRLALGIGFDPELTAHENIFLNASIIGLSMKKIRERHDDILKMAGLEAYLHTKVKFFSTGMVSRLKFAIAVNAEADIFFMDEFFGGVGDLQFKALSAEVFKESIVKGRTIIHVSHSLPTIKEHCQRVLLLHHGEMKALGPPEEVLPVYHQLMKQNP
ncbi:MAG: ATP-binding cassette domain-containing protein [Saprospiraceae bacterium]|nr:ABC transporter ATP-binding protein [Lewinella sp.]